MNDESKPMTFEAAVEIISRLRGQISGHLIGQETVIDQILIAMLANGHVLVEGVPGLGKTLLVRVLANCFDGKFKRIQFTPDLMPADITGHVLFDSERNRFRLRKGPIFTNILLADEINRSPAKTQAALLEVMQEKQVTLEGDTHEVSRPFMVLATQNPIEQEGTYPLPEAELDRFLMKVFMGYPTEHDEVTLTRKIANQVNDQISVEEESPIINSQQVSQLQAVAAAIAMDETVLEYTVRLVRATRNSSAIQRGAGTRACIALVRCARAKALLRGSDFVLPDDVKSTALPVMRHRVLLSAEMEIDGVG